MSTSVVIPTLNAGQLIAPLLSSLLSQTVDVDILVVDSSSDDDTTQVVRRFGERVRLLEIPRESFDHVGTRNLALSHCSGENVVFLAQDTLPADESCLERLLGALDNRSVAAAFGRHVPRPDAPRYEALIRKFNYPDQSRTWCEDDVPTLGVKAYFFSNAFSAYRRDALLAVGGFDEPVKSNEDMLAAEKLLHAGHALSYVSDARVIHSHAHTLRQDFERNVAIGYVMESHRERLCGSDEDSEGWRMVRSVAGGLVHEGDLKGLLEFGAHACARFAGNRLGKRRAREAGDKWA